MNSLVPERAPLLIISLPSRFVWFHNVIPEVFYTPVQHFDLLSMRESASSFFARYVYA